MRETNGRGQQSVMPFDGLPSPSGEGLGVGRIRLTETDARGERPYPNPFVSSVVEKPGTAPVACFSTSLETNGGR